MWTSTSGLLAISYYYYGVILAWIVIMWKGKKIRSSFDNYLQTFET